MNTSSQTPNRPTPQDARFIAIAGLILVLVLSLMSSGCSRKTADSENAPSLKPGMAQPTKIDPLRFVLVPMENKTPLDAKIATAQSRVRGGINREAALENLGWLFVAKAHASFDSGYYKFAEQCALAIEAQQPGDGAAKLLRGHVLQNLHRFKEAEPLALELTEQRGSPADFGLLGDVLMEQGRLDEAVTAYQQMADLKPDAQAMTRAGHMRWLKGDLTGAIEVMSMAAETASRGDADTAAWIHSRLAFYLLQAANLDGAGRVCRAALTYQPDYPPALLIQGRILLAQGKATEAVEPLRRAAAGNPIPEYLWVLSEALNESSNADEAARIETKLRAQGATVDPRRFALFLATRGEQSGSALRMANAELAVRQDVFTWDAVAWSLAAMGHWTEAQENMARALAAGTKDPRLLLHAAAIASELKQEDQKQKFLGQIQPMEPALLPSERRLLAKLGGKGFAAK